MSLTLEDIAKISGYSRSTVSRVINGEESVSERAREQVMNVIQNLNFQPNLAARGLAAGRTGVLSLVIPVGVGAIFTDPFFPQLIQNVSSACNALDYTVMLWLAEPEYERRMISKIMYNGLVDGVIVSSMVMDDPIVKALAQGKLPFVLIGRHPNNPKISYIDVDNRVGAREAVLHLIRMGRKRIATITGPQNTIVGYDRYQGYLDALQERGVAVDPNLIIESDFTAAGSYAAALRLIAQRPDAVFAASDPMAISALRAFQEAGFSVPGDLAIIGFDDIPQSAQTNPPLTTVRQPTARMGRIAVETVVDMIHNPSEEPHRIVLPAELVIRSSCGTRMDG
ncbi:hypothetical protein ADN00_03895 [Ornatilinea apprima]|uniref:HTH lacI-type domain-containing protein n=1 Tax=Ornatilinea apprima TaxID=1134406 RepID=A0A0P6Y282_9CHLR|nr:LacI family DNA-binding transcriptional regulator [Ornatilinea apprima]KPL79041.1 hypothetical protein ADN00_03895 [Ornatilinea apprima]